MYWDAVFAATVGDVTRGVGAETGADGGCVATPAQLPKLNVYDAFVVVNGCEAPICCVRLAPAKSPTYDVRE